jgi:hypothetical protein
MLYPVAQQRVDNGDRNAIHTWWQASAEATNGALTAWTHCGPGSPSGCVRSANWNLELHRRRCNCQVFGSGCAGLGFGQPEPPTPPSGG